jgi:exodeoxyribonuclease III
MSKQTSLFGWLQPADKDKKMASEGSDDVKTCEDDAEGQYKIISYNIDGLRPNVWLWICDFLKREKPHILCLHETKLAKHVLQAMFDQINNTYVALINEHNPSCWHGVVMLIRKDVNFTIPPQAINLKNLKSRSDNKSLDATKGRVLTVLVENQFYLVTTYVPNAGIDKLKHLNYRIQHWDPALQAHLNELQLEKPVLWMGDINVAPEEVDVVDPKRMSSWAGFTPEERKSFKEFLASGNKWIDIWRQQHPKTKQFSFRGKAHKWASSGMRLDNAIVSSSLVKDVTQSDILVDCQADTDHVPILVCISVKTQEDVY